MNKIVDSIEVKLLFQSDTHIVDTVEAAVNYCYTL